MWWQTLLTKGLSFFSGWGGYLALAGVVALSVGWTTYTLTEQIYNGRIAAIQRDHAEEVNLINQKTAEAMKTIAETIGVEEGRLAESLSDSLALSAIIKEELNNAKPEEVNDLGPAALRAIDRLRNSQRRSD